MKIFKDRQSAGKLLAKKLKGRGDLGGRGIVLGIPRGGVVVAAEIAKQLNLPLDILVVRKIGAPGQSELALGAVDADGEVVGDVREIRDVREIVEREIEEIKRREKVYRGGKKALEVKGKVVILVDDGIATGATAEAAINYLKRHGSEKIILAVPVASKEAVREIRGIGEIKVLEIPEYFQAVGQFYQDFPQVLDKEVVSLLK